MTSVQDGLVVEVEHRQGGFSLLAAFAAPSGVTALFGRSGSGKTTLVNVLAGLIRPTRGRLAVGGETLLDTEAGFFTPAHRRRVGYVFQEGRLFPHLTVRQNLLFGRWFAGPQLDGLDLAATVELLGIGHLLARRPGTLSGGEKQRVAIGRALLSRPRLLLMDEPLASLDEARKSEILPYLERLRGEARVPIVYVSHAVGEVSRLADTVVLLEAGSVVAAGRVAEVLARLDLPGLAGTRDMGSILEVRVDEHDERYGLSTLSTPAGALVIPRVPLPPGASTRVRIGARDVTISLAKPPALSALNVLPALVEAVAEGDAGPTVDVRLRCGEASLLAQITRKSLDSLALRPGLPVHAIIKAVVLDGA